MKQHPMTPLTHDSLPPNLTGQQPLQALSDEDNPGHQQRTGVLPTAESPQAGAQYPPAAPGRNR